MKQLMNLCRAFGVVFVIFLFAGCTSFPLPISEIQVNVALYRDSDDLVMRVKELTYGMSKQEVFNVLGVNEKTPNLRLMSEQEIRQILYGETRPSTFGEGKNFHSRVGKLEGVEIPYISKKLSAAFTLPFHAHYVEKGRELFVVLVFSAKENQSHLFNKRVIGVAVIDKTEKKILFNPFVQKNEAIVK